MAKTIDELLIGVLGAGSIGCFVGGSLQESGCPVRYFGREHVASDVRSGGLRLTSHDGQATDLAAEAVDFRTDLSGLEECNILLVCVKSPATEVTADALAGVIRPDTVVISLQNGVANTDVLKSRLPYNTVLAGMVAFNVARLEGAHFHLGTDGEIYIEDHPVARMLVDRLNAVGVSAKTSPDMKAVLWGKLLLNLNNGLNVLSDMPLRRQLLDRDYRRALALLVEETLGVLKAAGVSPAKIGKAPPGLIAPILRLPNWLFERVAASMLKIDDKARSSMRDDLDRGRKSEIAFINGAVVELAAKVNASVPVNAAIIALVEDAFAKGQSPALEGRDLLKRLQR
ncbi:2-dehydropantoate 2-reductase [Hoeflea sp. WL0058]|uniref:2-dehydropantoate 2-reductase n=1 Tax=Flavimaribacter sediminis TaxID=2865987 RepID=A0AAE3CYZ1_9HYPH|nr:2-dehydropantoate 2-reductase [Flavimaribacter sediminis]MBW8636800.1 2-dehydropantoate 2-reductase [Flavimaribacter sediminis]